MGSNTGPFIVFEGVEGSGKTTQTRTLARKLINEGIDHIVANDPGITPLGKRVRRWLKSDETASPITELFLFLGARSALTDSTLRGALEEGKVVISHRYTYSTLAYQGYGRGLDIEMLKNLNNIATGGLTPDLVILLDLSTQQGMERIAYRPLDRIEQEGIDFHDRVRRGYKSLASESDVDWLIIDGSRPKSQISKIIWENVSNLISQKKFGH